ncbi:MAG: energy-coupling factor transporter transmembrane component T [Bifidobacterium mongoliense]|uniref:energy-coupling factor transporter transmembrane component T n=1 Tax=Bifidobacterium mongoliense TaxID=518643 RepID=UPI002F35D517
MNRHHSSTIHHERPTAWNAIDPRTKIIYVMTVGIFSLGMMGWSSRSTGVVCAALAFSPLLLLTSSGRLKIAAGYAVMIAGSYALSVVLVPRLGSIPAGWLLYASVHILVQMLPCAMSAFWMLATTSASQLIAALQRMHVPQSVAMAAAVMFRFLPTAVAEQHAINDAMRMRGVRLAGSKASAMFEYRVIPLMTNAVRIADELSQAALTRGLGAHRTRSSIARIGFHAKDVCFLAVVAACYAVWALGAVGMLP